MNDRSLDYNKSKSSAHSDSYAGVESLIAAVFCSTFSAAFAGGRSHARQPTVFLATGSDLAPAISTSRSKSKLFGHAFGSAFLAAQTFFAANQFFCFHGGLPNSSVLFVCAGAFVSKSRLARDGKTEAESEADYTKKWGFHGGNRSWTMGRVKKNALLMRCVLFDIVPPR